MTGAEFQRHWRVAHPDKSAANDRKKLLSSAFARLHANGHGWVEEAYGALRTLRAKHVSRLRCRREAAAVAAHRSSLPEWVKEATAVLAARHVAATSARSSARYRARHPETVRMRTAFRKAVIRGSGGDGIAVSQWASRIEEFGGRCAYCMAAVSRPEIDHVWPVSRGGDHVIDNAVPACRSCNARKGAKGPLVMAGVPQ